MGRFVFAHWIEMSGVDAGDDDDGGGANPGADPGAADAGDADVDRADPLDHRCAARPEASPFASFVRDDDDADDAPTTPYWYNAVTGAVRDSPPEPPLRVPLDEEEEEEDDDAGAGAATAANGRAAAAAAGPEDPDDEDDSSFLWVEDEEDRVMPPEAAVRASGRWDLHHAILRRGGYRAVGRLLDRRPAWPRARLDSGGGGGGVEARRQREAAVRSSRAAMLRVSTWLGLGNRALPPAVGEGGGNRRPRPSLSAPKAPRGSFDSTTARGGLGRGPSGLISVADAAEPRAPALPSVAALRAAGRPDLAAAVERAGGSAAAAALLGFAPLRRPRGHWGGKEGGDEGGEEGEEAGPGAERGVPPVPLRAAAEVLLWTAAGWGGPPLGAREGGPSREDLAALCAAARLEVVDVPATWWRRDGLESVDDDGGGDRPPFGPALSALRAEALRRGATLPSDRDLRAARRGDLRYALQRAARGDTVKNRGEGDGDGDGSGSAVPRGRAAVAWAAGLRARGRGRPRGGGAG